MPHILAFYESANAFRCDLSEGDQGAISLALAFAGAQAPHVAGQDVRSPVSAHLSPGPNLGILDFVLSDTGGFDPSPPDVPDQSSRTQAGVDVAGVSPRDVFCAVNSPTQRSRRKPSERYDSLSLTLRQSS